MRFLRLAGCVFALTFALGANAVAQDTQAAKGARPAQDAGSIGGTVHDTSGGVIPHAAVTVSNGADVTQETVSNEQGEYAVTGLPPGTYILLVTQKGFKDFQGKGLVLAAGQKLSLDATLEAAAASSSITVEGQQAAAVETETAQIAGTVTQKEIVSLGLNGRNFTQLIALAPGVSNQTGQDEALVGVKGSVKYSVNGGRVEYNTFDVDGSDVLNAGFNGSRSTLIVYPSLDAIQEVKVLTSNYGALYGRSASGSVLVTTKSGGNKFHGDGYEFLRNEIFNARNFFDQTHGAPLYRRNDFGFTLGGPLFIPGHYNTNKDKTFFFFSEEARLERSPEPFNQAAPSVAERTGDFSDVCPFAAFGINGEPGQQVPFKRSKYPDCPAQTGAGTNDVTFPGNQVPIDPNSAVLLASGVIPAPTSTTGCNSSIGSCYDAVISPPTTWRQELFKLDHNITNNMRASFRYIHDAWDTTTTTPQFGFVQNSFPTIENHFLGPGISLVAHLTNIITPTLVNEFIISYTTSHISLTDVAAAGVNLQRPPQCSPTVPQPCLSIGYLFPPNPILPFGGKLPGLNIGGTNAAYGGNGFAVDPSFEPWKYTNPTVTLRDDITKTVGKHTLQFGVHIVLAHKNEINSAAGPNTGDVQGIITFTNQNSIFSTLNAFADFLHGNVRAFQQDSAQLKYYNSYHIAEPYFQDDWRVSSRLTLNLGLRVSLFGLYHEKYDRAYNWQASAFNPAIAPQVDPFFGVLLDPTTQQPIPLNLNNLDPRIINGVVQCGVNGVPQGCMKGHVFNPAPRIGFAWDPRGDGKTAIRAGYGIFFHHGTGNEANTGSLEGSPPLVLDMTQNNPFGYACIGGVGAGCGGAGAYPINVTAIPTKAVWPYVQQWSLSVQRELSPTTIASIAYVGSKGTHLTAARQINQLTPLNQSQNPFLPGQPISSAICYTFDGANFTLNNTMLSAGQPGFINLEAACYGTPGKNFPDVNALRTFAPGLDRIFSLENIANSSYHALQFTVRRTHGPLSVDLAYSYSHSIDDSSDRFDSTFVNSANLQSNRASSNFDQRHLLNMSYVYDFSIPGLRGVLERAREWANAHAEGAKANHTDSSASKPGDSLTPTPQESASGLKHKLLDNWEFSGITTVQSGTPFSVVNGASAITGISSLDNAGVANGVGAGSYPDFIELPGTPPNGGNNSKSFGPILGNPGEFVAPQGLTFGDAGRNSLNNPHRVNFDMALLKRFHVSENSSLELRAEAFNVFNHTQFRIYDSEKGNTGSNTVSCYGGPNNSASFVDPTKGGVNCLVGNSFLHPVDAHRPRTLQLGVKFIF